MSTSRNESTEISKAIWQKVDSAANHAPAWVRNNISSLAANTSKQTPPPAQSVNKDNAKVRS
jgi:hypothetical protein